MGEINQHGNFTMSDKIALQKTFIQSVLESASKQLAKSKGLGKAPVNIALSKYWGKREPILNLPMNGSVSISLPGLGTETELSLISGEQNEISLNGEVLNQENPFFKRTSEFLNLFKTDNTQAFAMHTINTVPTAAGLASSASGYAALVLALDDLFQWQLPVEKLTLLARLGSGSASRSLFKGFAQWHAGEQENGLDSYAEALPQQWSEFSIGLVKVNVQQKPISSTAGMQNTVHHCDLYQPWPQKAERDKATIIQAIADKDFSTLGATAENNALAMHATMIATWPPILYWQAESVAAMHKVWQLREKGVEVYFTMDAGPNLKLIMLEKDIPSVKAVFGEDLQVIQPFKS